MDVGDSGSDASNDDDWHGHHHGKFYLSHMNDIDLESHHVHKQEEENKKKAAEEAAKKEAAAKSVVDRSELMTQGCVCNVFCKIL